MAELLYGLLSFSPDDLGPVPAWQVAGSIVVNLIGVVVLLWLAAKVFRVGLLMYGKPPNFRTLLKWIRMA